jgi:putative phosphoesterase
MNTLILSDIHGNLPALEAVLEDAGHYDACLFLGDVVDYGPFPHECIAFLKKEMDVGVIGNHDNALAFDVDCGCRDDFRKFSHETRAWHKTLVTEDDRKFLRSLPQLNYIHVDGLSLFLAHATPQGDLYQYLGEDEVETAMKGIQAHIVLLGHTHIQFKKQLDSTLVVNPGSVGLARDGGQACYAFLRDGTIEFHRVKYDVERTVNALWKAPISQESKEGLTRVLRGEVTAHHRSGNKR